MLFQKGVDKYHEMKYSVFTEDNLSQNRIED